MNYDIRYTCQHCFEPQSVGLIRSIAIRISYIVYIVYGIRITSGNLISILQGTKKLYRMSPKIEDIF